MRNATKALAGILVLAAAGWFAGCNGTIDNGNGPPVVLEVENVTIPPVSATLDSAGACTYTLTPGTAQFKNKPKNSGADKSPFNDIILKNVDITSHWDDALTTAFTSGLGGSVPAAGNATAQFVAANAGELIADTRAGHSASLTLDFHGQTVAGDNVSVSTGGTIVVNSCTAPLVGACCTTGGGCSSLSAVDCGAAGGTYQGDGTSCLTTICP
jgi:hypothetical protein